MTDHTRDSTLCESQAARLAVGSRQLPSAPHVSTSSQASLAVDDSAASPATVLGTGLPCAGGNDSADRRKSWWILPCIGGGAAVWALLICNMLA